VQRRYYRRQWHRSPPKAHWLPHGNSKSGSGDVAQRLTLRACSCFCPSDGTAAKLPDLLGIWKKKCCCANLHIDDGLSAPLTCRCGCQSQAAREQHRQQLVIGVFHTHGEHHHSRPIVPVAPVTGSLSALRRACRLPQGGAVSSGTRLGWRCPASFRPVCVRLHRAPPVSRCALP